MNLTEKAKEFQDLQNDVEKWKWIKENSDLVTVWLDNDSTDATFDDGDDDTPILFFNNFLGSGGGIEDLMSSISIKSSGA